MLFIAATLVALGALILVAAWPRLLERAPDPLLDRASRIFPRDPQPYLLRGERRLAAGETRAALVQFERAAALGSRDFRLAVAVADAMRAAGLHEKAAAQARELLAVEPESGRLRRILGQSLLEMGQLAEGIAALEEAARRAPRDLENWIALAEAHLGIEGFQPRTARAWEEGLSHNPGDARLKHGLAESYAGLGRYEEAEALLRDLPEQPLPETPKARDLYARAWAARGVVLRRLRPDPERRAQAKAALERALALAPGQPETHYELGLLLAEEGDLKAACASLERATRLRPYAHPFWYHLARVYRQQGLAQQAAHAQARFDLLVGTFAAVNRESRHLDAHPQDFPRRLRLARLLMERWDWDAAALHLSLALRDHPGHPEATRLLQRLHEERQKWMEDGDG